MFSGLLAVVPSSWPKKIMESINHDHCVVSSQSLTLPGPPTVSFTVMKKFELIFNKIIYKVQKMFRDFFP